MSKRQMHPPADVEIAHLQQRIYLHRIGLRLSIETAQQAIRERLASPGMLVAAGVTGFMLERLTHRGAPRTKAAESMSSSTGGALGVVAEAARTGLRFLQSGPGLWLAARLAARAAEHPSPEDPANRISPAPADAP